MSDATLPVPGLGFHHVAIRAKDFDKSLKFYTQGLGLTVGSAWGASGKRAVMLRCNDSAFVEIFERPAEQWTDADPAILHFAFRTTDVDAATARAVEAGAVVTTAPKDIPLDAQPPLPGPIRLSFVKGPDGELIEFITHPSI